MKFLILLIPAFLLTGCFTTTAPVKQKIILNITSVS